MHRRILSILLFSIGCSVGMLFAQVTKAAGMGADASAPVEGSADPPVTLTLLSERGSIDPDSLEAEAGVLIGLEVKIDTGWYFSWQSLEKADAEPTIAWQLPEGFRIESLPQQKPKPYRYLGLESYGYEGEVVFLYRLYPMQKWSEGDVITLTANVEWLLCSDVCIPGSQSLELSLVVAGDRMPSGVEVEVAERLKHLEQVLLRQAVMDAERLSFEERILNLGLFGWLFLAFIGGLLLNLMPCVLPVLSIKLVSLIQSVDGEASKRVQSGVFYSLGAILAFIVLAGLLFTLRAIGESIGWGFQLQNPYFIVFLVGLFFVIALNLFGVFELGTSWMALGAKQAPKSSGIWASFATGVLAAIVGAPCIGPFVGGVSALALQLDLFTGVAIFAMLGFGLAFPFFILALFPRWIQWLPKPGPWMLSFKRFMGVLMLLSTGFLIWVVGRSAGFYGILYLCVWLLVLGFSIWTLGRWGSFAQAKALRLAMLSLAMGVFILGVVLSGQAVAERYKASQIDRRVTPSSEGFWKVWSPDLVEKSLLEGRPVFIDFTADWCLICQSNKVFVLNTKKTKALLDRYNVLPLVADWTLRDEAISDALASYGRSGVPLYILLSPEGRIERLPQNLSYGILKQRLEALLNTPDR